MGNFIGRKTGGPIGAPIGGIPIGAPIGMPIGMAESGMLSVSFSNVVRSDTSSMVTVCHTS